VPVRDIDMDEVFGRDNVARWDESALAGLDLPEDAVRVLGGVGLPRHMLEGTFDAEPPVAATGFARPGEYVRFGSCFGGLFCLDLATGEVWLMPLFSRATPGFVNSTMELFAETLLHWYVLMVNKPQRLGPDLTIAERWGSAVEAELAAIDPRAVEDDTFYAEFIADFKFGRI